MKRKHSVGYFSSYDRGLECLLAMWPAIRKQVPDATLDIYYGWNSFDNAHRSNPEMMKWKWGVIRKLSELKDQGVTEHGRVDHKTLAEKMKEIQVLAYPTTFTEISCITAMKAQAAGCYPVVNAIAALDETVQYGTKLYLDNLYEDKEQQQKFIDAVVEALKQDYHPQEAQKWVIDTYSWSKIAEGWHNAMAD